MNTRTWTDTQTDKCVDWSVVVMATRVRCVHVNCCSVQTCVRAGRALHTPCTSPPSVPPSISFHAPGAHRPTRSRPLIRIVRRFSRVIGLCEGPDKDVRRWRLEFHACAPCSCETPARRAHNPTPPSKDKSSGTREGKKWR